MQTNRGTTLRLAAGAATLAIALTACQSRQPVADLAGAVAAPAPAAPALMLAAQSEAARAEGKADAAVSFAELAVTADLQNVEARSSLAKAYVAAGRFQSAAEAYDDLAAIQPGDDGAAFRAALVELAKGNRRSALVKLDALLRNPSLAADVGLAFALAGEAERAAALLTATVRSGGSTPRLRQNLALAQALAGEWAAARATASIDLSPDLVNARVAEWAALASNTDSAWRTATVLGVTPAAIDAGRPAQLAWSPPAVMPLAAERQVAAAVPEAPLAALPIIRAEPIKIAAVEVPPAQPKPFVFDAPAPKPVVAAAEPEVVKAEVVKAKAAAPTSALAPKAVSAVKRDVRALPKTSNGEWVVQLGSYAKPEYLTSGWQGLIQKNKALGEYKPMKSSIEVAGSKYHRLSVGTFAKVAEAEALCDSLKAAGQKCFVRKGEGSSVAAVVPKRA